jgi:predicted dehydrogenase
VTNRVRVAVVGVGDFGRQHTRVYSALEQAQLIGVFDTDRQRAEAVSQEFGIPVIDDLESVAKHAQAVSLAVPTVEHAWVGCWLLDRGVDVLVEKPIASSIAEADQLAEAARRGGRILQVGHVERFNPAVVAAAKIINGPLFFEVHRLGVFTPRSLDVDVVYDVMIHDLDILLALAGPVEEVKAVGIPVVTDKVDIAHARLEFSAGAVANVTASRVSTERVRKLRFFQHREYISLDYARRDGLRIRVAEPGPQPRFEFEKLPVETEEPLKAELQSFVEAAQTRSAPVVDALAGRNALELANRVMASIDEHARKVRMPVKAPQAAP